MDKELTHYQEYVHEAVNNYESHKTSIEIIHTMFTSHVERVKEFQHERLVHLIVTLFFSFVMLISFAMLIAYVLFTPTGASILFMVLLIILTVLLLITVLFYVYYYYKLENGTQRLYIETDRLMKLLQK